MRNGAPPDAHPLPSAPQIFCIFLECIAAVFFGLVLSELQEIFAGSNARSRDLSAYLESVLHFLKEIRWHGM
jgi:hypothetical protein